MSRLQSAPGRPRTVYLFKSGAWKDVQRFNFDFDRLYRVEELLWCWGGTASFMFHRCICFVSDASCNSTLDQIESGMIIKIFCLKSFNYWSGMVLYNMRRRLQNVLHWRHFPTWRLDCTTFPYCWLEFSWNHILGHRSTSFDMTTSEFDRSLFLDCYCQLSGCKCVCFVYLHSSERHWYLAMRTSPSHLIGPVVEGEFAALAFIMGSTKSGSDCARSILLLV